jgi:hypothetical protein
VSGGISQAFQIRDLTSDAGDGGADRASYSSEGSVSGPATLMGTDAYRGISGHITLTITITLPITITGGWIMHPGGGGELAFS